MGVLAGRGHVPGRVIPGRRYAGARERDPRHRCYEHHRPRRSRLEQRADAMGRLQANGSSEQPRRRVACLQLQRLQQRHVLRHLHRPRRRAGAGPRDRGRSQQLRPGVSQHGHELARCAPAGVPRVDLDGLGRRLLRYGAHQRLLGDADRLRADIPDPPRGVAIGRNVSQIARVFEVVRPVALGTLRTPHERARERHRRIALSAFAALVARVVAVIANLVAVPLALGSLGTERYGVWVTLSSFVLMLWQAVGTVAGLAGLIVAIRFSAGMTGVALALSGGIAFGAAANYVAFFARRPWLRPSLAAFRAKAARIVLRRGMLFFVLQIAAGLAFASDSVVADQVLGPEAAARYSVAQRLFFLPPVIIALATTPLWPAYSEALARGDRKWVRTIFMRSGIGSVLIAALGGAVLTLLRGPIFSIWVGPDLVPSLSFSLALAIWAVLYSWGAAVVVLLNAANVIMLQAVAALPMGVASLVLKTYLASALGIEGIVWGVIAAYVALTFIPYTIYFIRWSPVAAAIPHAVPTGEAA